MFFNILIFILLFSNIFHTFGQNINDPDYYPSQINPNNDPFRRYLRLWSGILRNVAGDSEPNYYQQTNNVRDYQQNNFLPSYNNYNDKPFENLLQLWKKKIEEINLSPKNYNDGIPISQLKPKPSMENINNNQKDFSSSLSDNNINNNNNNNDKEIINEMLLHKLLPRNKGDLYAFTSTTLKPSTTTTKKVISEKIKNKKIKKSKKKNTTKVISSSTLPTPNPDIGKNYKAKVRIGPTLNLEETTIIPSIDLSTLKVDVEGSGEEITTIENESSINPLIDSDEEDSGEVEEVHINENDIKDQEEDNLDNTNSLEKTNNEVLNNNTTSKNSNSTRVEKNNNKVIEESSKESDNSEGVEYVEEEDDIDEKNLKNNVTDLNKNVTEGDNKEDNNEIEYSEEEEEEDEEEEEEVLTTIKPTTTTTMPTTTTTIPTTTTTKKVKSANNGKNTKQPKKEKSSKPTKPNKNNKKKIDVEKKEKYTIPEAEEEEDFLLPNHSYASQIDSIPEVETSSVTTTKSPSQAQSVYNFYTNANANSTPNNSNTVVPVNTMVDGILPLLIPLLASRTPYLQNMLDNLAYGVKTDNNILPIKNNSLIEMSKNKNNYNEEDENILNQVDKKNSHIKEDKNLLNKKKTLDYISSIRPKRISNTNNKENIQYYKTKLPEIDSNIKNIPMRPTKL
uniref:ShKT domain-containing protein n=1 Tax=Strongyloides stercoralis TaxID=6248 RepID=A0A0K0EQJ8_STRER